MDGILQGIVLTATLWSNHAFHRIGESETAPVQKLQLSARSQSRAPAQRALIGC